jgi:inner membrane protein
MDSLTQIALGASTLASVAPAQHVRRALIYGAILGTLPDLDALIPFADPLDRLILHRSASHSLLVLPVLAWLLCLIARQFDGVLRTDYWRWLVGFELALVTHPLLDGFTIYGTQLFWPLSTYPLGLGSVFVIDPAYTVPLLLACMLAWRRQSEASRRVRRPLIWALAWSCGYLLFGVIAQAIVTRRVLLDQPGVARTDLNVVAAPLTGLLYRIVKRQRGGYAEAYVSLLDSGAMRWAHFDSADQLIPTLLADAPGNAARARAFERLRAFSKGFFVVERAANGHVIVRDLRMGSAPNYAFSFDLGTVNTPIHHVTQLPMARPGFNALPWIIKRIYTPAAKLPLAHELAAAP